MYNIKISRENIAKIFRESKEILILIHRMYIKPGESFTRMIEIATMKKIIKSLIVYYTFFSPLMVIYGITYIFTINGGSNSLLLWIFTIIFSLSMGIVTGLGFSWTALFAVSIIGGIYYGLGKILGYKGSFSDVLSAVTLYIAGASIIVLPELITIWIFTNLGIKITGLISVWFFTIIFFNVVYLPVALAKSFKTDILKSFIIANLLPLLFVILGFFLWSL